MLTVCADLTLCSYKVHDDPVFTIPHDNKPMCIIGGGVYRGSAFHSDFYGAYFYGDFVTRRLHYLRFSEDGTTALSTHEFHRSTHMVQDITFDHKGDLWYLGQGGSGGDPHAVFRITYSGETGNKPPRVTSVFASTTSGEAAPLHVTFVGSAVDDDSARLVYAWDFGDGAPFGSSPIARHTYTRTGVFRARLYVSDGKREVGSEVIEVQVGSKTEVVIASPKHGAVFRADEAIQFFGTAKDRRCVNRKREP